MLDVTVSSDIYFDHRGLNQKYSVKVYNFHRETSFFCYHKKYQSIFIKENIFIKGSTSFWTANVHVLSMRGFYPQPQFLTLSFPSLGWCRKNQHHMIKSVLDYPSKCCLRLTLPNFRDRTGTRYLIWPFWYQLPKSLNFLNSRCRSKWINLDDIRMHFTSHVGIYTQWRINIMDHRDMIQFVLTCL